MKIEVTDYYLNKVLEIAKEMRNKGTWDDKEELEKIIVNTKRYLNKINKEERREYGNNRK